MALIRKSSCAIFNSLGLSRQVSQAEQFPSFGRQDVCDGYVIAFIMKCRTNSIRDENWKRNITRGHFVSFVWEIKTKYNNKTYKMIAR